MSSTSAPSASSTSATSATHTTAEAAALGADTAPRRLVAFIGRARQAAILLVLVLLLLATELDNHRFLSSQGIKDLLLDAAILMLVAVGQAVVVITRNVDLSVGSVLGISAFAAGNLLAGGANPVWAVLAAILLGAGAGFGLVNGLLVSFGQVPALVVTLGMLYVVRGLDSIWVGPREITSQSLPAGFTDFGHGGLGPIPYLALIAVAATVAVGYYLARYRSGREFYAIGSNAQAARLAGIGLRKRVVAAYIFAGALAGLDDLRATRDAQRARPGFGALVDRSVVYLRRRWNGENDVDPAIYLMEIGSDGRRMRQVELPEDGTAIKSGPEDWPFNPPMADLFDPDLPGMLITAEEFEYQWQRARQEPHEL